MRLLEVQLAMSEQHRQEEVASLKDTVRTLTDAVGRVATVSPPTLRPPLPSRLTNTACLPACWPAYTCVCSRLGQSAPAPLPPTVQVVSGGPSPEALAELEALRARVAALQREADAGGWEGGGGARQAGQAREPEGGREGGGGEGAS